MRLQRFVQNEKCLKLAANHQFCTDLEQAFLASCRGVGPANASCLRRAPEFIHLIYLIPPSPKGRIICLGTKVPFSFRDGSKRFSYSFLLTKVVFVQVKNPFYTISSQASGTVSKCKVAAEFVSSIATWQQLLHSHMKLNQSDFS